MSVHAIEGGVLDRAACVFEIQINSIRRPVRQLLNEVVALVIDGRIETQFVRQAATFVVAACRTDNSHAFDLRNLPDE
jgi:hypothetical protein